MSPSIDWKTLLARAKQLDEPLTDEELALWKRGLIDGNTRMWNVQYVHAAQRAFAGGAGATDELHAMMRAEIPMPAFLLPTIISKHTGAPGLTMQDDEIARRKFNLYVSTLGMKPAEATKKIAEERYVNVKTIQRSLKRTET